MRWWSFVLFFAFTYFSAQQIEWTESTKLTWNDFRSAVSTSQKTNVAAYAYCGWKIETELSSDLKQPIVFEIRTYFDPAKSWKDPSKANDYILNHEQKHFDIAEIYARKIRKAVAEKIKNSADYNKYFKTFYAQLTREYKDFQKKYDSETEHGINTKKQEEFNLLIEKELSQLKEYKKP